MFGLSVFLVWLFSAFLSGAIAYNRGHGAGWLCDVNERPTERLLNAVVEDEGRPLGIGVQKPAPNQAVLL